MQAAACASVWKVTKTAFITKPDESSCFVACCMNLPIFFSSLCTRCWRLAA